MLISHIFTVHGYAVGPRKHRMDNDPNLEVAPPGDGRGLVTDSGSISFP